MKGEKNFSLAVAKQSTSVILLVSLFQSTGESGPARRRSAARHTGCGDAEARIRRQQSEGKTSDGRGGCSTQTQPAPLRSHRGVQAPSKKTRNNETDYPFPDRFRLTTELPAVVPSASTSRRRLASSDFLTRVWKNSLKLTRMRKAFQQKNPSPISVDASDFTPAPPFSVEGA
jgi:hypothetical protein